MPGSEGWPSVQPDVEAPRSGSEVYPGTGSAHCVCATVFPCGALWSWCEQQFPPGSCSQKTCSRIQMAHPVGICQASTVFSYRSCCGTLEFTHLNFNIKINKPHLFCLFSLLSQQLSWILKSPWCLGIWWMSWHNTWENIPEIISKRSAVLHWNYLHCMVSRYVSTNFPHFNKLFYPRFEKQYHEHKFFWGQIKLLIDLGIQSVVLFT